MKSIFEGLEPKAVWTEFEKILEIPRPSKHEEKIRNYLLQFAQSHDLVSRVDAKGNVVIERSASPGREDEVGVVLQSHMDMVCEKDAALEHDFFKDPIQAYVENGWVKARGTTLGADCGIGMALSLALLIDDQLSCPPLEALFTVDEEQGLSGAKELDATLVKGRHLVNLDSEDDGEIYVGCAGGIDTFGQITPTMEPISGVCALDIEISGLSGGHSGDDIDKGRASAVKMMGWVLCEIDELLGSVRLVTIDGGNLRNAIAREASACVLVDGSKFSRIEQLIGRITKEFKQLYGGCEPDLEITISLKDDFSDLAMSIKDTQKVIGLLQSLPHGVQDMSRVMSGMVETSTNLASIKIDPSGVLHVVTSQRSSHDASKRSIAKTIALTMSAFGFTVSHSDGYPGWAVDMNSAILAKAEKTYKKIFSEVPKVKSIHAGLECGLIIEKFEGMDAISIGPTMRGVHSPAERVEIKAVERAYLFTRALLMNADK